MGIINFIKNTFFDNDEDFIEIFDNSHLKEKIETKKYKQKLDNIYEVHHARTIINPHKESLQINTSYIQKPTKKSSYKENVKKGKDYERYVGRYIESFDFEVEYRGLRMGRRDGGIDLIAKKNNIFVLIQCKNWSKKKVTQKDIRVFVGDYYTYLEEHPELHDKKTKAYFYISNDLIELRDIATVAEVIIKSALSRQESRGTHYTLDYPERDDENWNRDTIMRK